MTQEEKELLIKDLCGRLPHGIICSIYREDDEGFGWRDAECKGYFKNNDSYEFYFEDVIAVDNIERLKPYLRPFSSMTENEIRLFRKNSENEYRYAYEARANNESRIEIIQIDCDAWTKDETWLNAHHFDYRGLIEKGLALQAPEGMYKFSDNTIENE